MHHAAAQMRDAGLRHLLRAVAVFSICALGALDATAAEKAPIKVGVIDSLSGVTAAIGTPEADAVTVLAQKINREGGIKGHLLELVIFDDTSSPVEAARGATKLIQQDKVVAIIGSTTGSSTLALAPVTARYQTPLLATVATIPVINKESAFFPWTFRAMTNEGVTTRATLQRLAATGVKKIAVLYQEDAYGKSASEIVIKLAAEYKLTIAETVTTPLNATDLTAQATKLRNAEPEAIVLLVTPPALIAGFSRAARQVGLNAVAWGGIAFNQRAYLDLIGKDGEGINAMLLANFDEPTSGAQALASLMRAAGKTPNGFTEIAATNALLHLVKALESDPEATGEMLRVALERVCNLKTYGEGMACYSAEDHNGWNVDALIQGKIQNGKFVTIR